MAKLIIILITTVPDSSCGSSQNNFPLELIDNIKCLPRYAFNSFHVEERHEILRLRQ
jgi:hypothetical protein